MQYTVSRVKVEDYDKFKQLFFEEGVIASVRPTALGAYGSSAAPVTRRKSYCLENGMIWRTPAGSSSRTSYESNNSGEGLLRLCATKRWNPSEWRYSSTEHHALGVVPSPGQAS